MCQVLLSQLSHHTYMWSMIASDQTYKLFDGPSQRNVVLAACYNHWMCIEWIC